MDTTEKTMVNIRTTIDAAIDKVWRLYMHPKHIVKWNQASADWHTPAAENDLRVGGRFLFRMESKDGTAGFDFSGIYTLVKKYKEIDYLLDDGRQVQVRFLPKGNETTINIHFEPEMMNTIRDQQEGWQAILNNFRDYVETLCRFVPLHFEITIDARADHVYRTMLDKQGFSEWTSVFNPTSRVEGTWVKGSKMLFLGEEKDGTTGGMVAVIRENIPNRFLSIEYAGVIREGKEYTEGPGVDDWAGGLENYSFSEVNRKTIVSVDTDANHEFKTYFMETWPKALNLLKQICERE